MSGGNTCTIVTCKSNSRISDSGVHKISFFTFPKDPNIVKEWVRVCCRKDKWNPKNKRICSKHFLLSDYEDELQARLLNYHPKHLKKDAIPTLFLPFSDNEALEVSESAHRRVSRENKDNDL